MKRLINFQSWQISKTAPYGAGSRPKFWIEEVGTNKKGLFKYPKYNPGSNGITGEYWAEDLACEIAKTIGIECANVDIGIFNNNIGSISYILTNENEELIEGVQYITKKYPMYNQDTFKDEKSGWPYSIAMILNVLKDYGFGNKFLEIPLFDYLIGNSDRHSSNWGIIKNIETQRERFSPLYDNGSSLMCYENEDKISDILKDKNRLEAKVNRKSLSIIRWDKMKKPSHLEMVTNLRKNYYNETCNIAKKICELTEDKIDNILKEYPNYIISDIRKKLIKYFLMYKIDNLKKVYFNNGGN